ncbi:MAG: hypothetical protein HY080_11095 [Gammaproteobacteria bacterium]|nr:hypothetical protein [Gammaproteobacteria bacterium]
MAAKSTPSRRTKPQQRKASADFIAKMAMRGKFRSFNQARAFVRKLKLGSYQEWLQYCRGELTGKRNKPRDIPQNPRDTYRDKGWKGFADWLGTGNIAYRQHEWRSFNAARAFVRRLKLATNKEWRAYVRGDMAKTKLPVDIPTNPQFVYKDKGWQGYGDWLGNDNVSYNDFTWRAFTTARTFVRKLKLDNEDAWRDYCRGRIKNKKPKPRDIPATPERVYQGQGWKGMADWLGKK